MRVDIGSEFESVAFDGHSWRFAFSGGVQLVAETLWRLLVDGRIALVSTDHHQLFGHREAVDLVAAVSSALAGRSLLAVTVDDLTADLKGVFDGGYTLEVFISSSGYESWSLTAGADRYIGGGGGVLM